MRLYIVGIEGFRQVADILLSRDVSYQVITDGRRTGEIACHPLRQGCILCRIFYEDDGSLLLRVWERGGAYPLVSLGTVRLNGVLCVFAAPAGFVSSDQSVDILFKQLQGE